MTKTWDIIRSTINLEPLRKETLETSLFPVKPVSSPTASFLLWKL